MTLLEKVFKPGAYTKPKNVRYLKPANPVQLDDAFSVYTNPDPDSRRTITLIKPPTIFSKNSYSTPVTQPIGLAYLGAVLEKCSYRVNIIDCPGRDVNRIRVTEDGRFKVQGLDGKRSLDLIDPASDVIGISIMFSQEWPYIREYINSIRAAFPNAAIIVGGEHVTAMLEYSFQECPAIDYAVIGEGELALLELVWKLRSGRPVDDVSGIAYRDGDTIMKTGLSPRLAELKNMPWPAWHLIDLEAHFNPNFTMGIGHGRNIAMIATRGCPYQCTFCSSPTMWTTRYVTRPVSEVVDEIEFYIDRYGVSSIEFYDLTAIVKKQWILDFIAELERRDVKISWQLPSGTRSESLDDPVIRGLAKTGCQFLVYAPESGSQRTLDMIKKRVKLKSLEKSIKAALHHGVVVKVNFIIAFPFETRADMIKTVLFAWKLALMNTDDCNISTFAPYPGSELFDQLVQENVFGEIDDQYFESLMAQFDFTVTRNVCRQVGPREVLFYRVVGMSVFYTMSYLRSPSRLVRLVKLLFQNRPFSPRSLFEQRIYDLIVRLRTSRASQLSQAADH
jgi:radical SAM superfamily enzyme YgiQ (UPF0313 family)